MSERLKQKSSVVIVETAENFVLEQRPNLPGKLAYPGKSQFLVVVESTLIECWKMVQLLLRVS